MKCVATTRRAYAWLCAEYCACVCVCFCTKHTPKKHKHQQPVHIQRALFYEWNQLCYWGVKEWVNAREREIVFCQY